MSTDTTPIRLEAPSGTLAYIDAARGYAILMVMIVHSGIAMPEVGRYLGWGARGVQLFFVISAVTLMASWERRGDGAAAFLARRAFRILPMFWLAIVFYCLVEPLGQGYWRPFGIKDWHVALTALCLHGFHPETITSVVPGGWSVAAEMTFYVLFPLIATRATTVPRAVVILLATMALSGLFQATRSNHPALFPGDPDRLVAEWRYLFVLNQLPVFATGILAYRVGLALQTADIANRHRLAELALVLALGYFALDAAANMQRSGFAFGIVAVALALGAGRYLVNRAICHLGQVSYSAYLVHFAMLLPARDFVAAVVPADWPLPVRHAILLVTLVGLTVMVSTITWRLIERPMIAAGSRLIRRFPTTRCREALAA